VLSNFLAGAFDSLLGSLGRGATNAARRTLPQRCELCAAPSVDRLLCDDCALTLPRLAPACPVCALPAQSGEVCGRCLSDPPSYDATLAAFAYAFPVDRLVQCFKYQGRLALADWCAESILQRISGGFDAVDRVVAMPLAVDRQRQRGYNQAAEIARVVCGKGGFRLLTKGVRRVRATTPQADLPWKQRAKNVRGAFACDTELQDLRIAVIDDVMTTGATLHELAKTLKAAGAAHVQNWIVARTPHDRHA
jgi:ComF family protein